jgi:hypothetical protein
MVKSTSLSSPEKSLTIPWSRDVAAATHLSDRNSARSSSGAALFETIISGLLDR